MNTKNLHALFDKYIEYLPQIDEQHSEYYKWVAAKRMSEFDFAGEDFAARFDALYTQAKAEEWDNLFDSQWSRPYMALLSYTKKYGQRNEVQDLLCNLLNSDDYSIAGTKSRIDRFINETEKLRAKYSPYEADACDTRAALQFLALHDPAHYYLLKNGLAKEFAKYAGFYEDWGTYSQFDLRIYTNFMDQLTAEIRNYPQLVTAQKKRLESLPADLHNDPQYHILAFDIIYCCTRYSFYDGVVKVIGSSKDIEDFKIKKAEAERLQKNLDDILEKQKLLKDAQDYIHDVAKESSYVLYKPLAYKPFEKWDILDISGDWVTISSGEIKRTVKLEDSIARNNLSFDDPKFSESMQKYAKVLMNELQIQQSFNTARKDIEPYLDYLN